VHDLAFVSRTFETTTLWVSATAVHQDCLMRPYRVLLP